MNLSTSSSTFFCLQPIRLTPKASQTLSNHLVNVILMRSHATCEVARSEAGPYIGLFIAHHRRLCYICLNSVLIACEGFYIRNIRFRGRNFGLAPGFISQIHQKPTEYQGLHDSFHCSILVSIRQETWTRITEREHRRCL